MHVEYIACLPILRELYEKPRDLSRFQWYLDQMLGTNEQGAPDVVRPITAANPMGRDHCLDAVKALLAIEADEVARRAYEEAAQAFPEVDHTVRASVTLLDDRGGGWTNRTLTEANFRFGNDPQQARANRTRHFVQTVCWSSDSYTPERIRAESRAALYRYAWPLRHGLPRTLRELMALDGGARAFAGEQPTLDEEELAYTRAILAPLLDSEEHGVHVAALFGDEAARDVGYAPQGVGPRAGFELALHEALAQQGAP